VTGYDAPPGAVAQADAAGRTLGHAAQKLEAMRSEIEAWEEVSRSTSFDA